jgi:hypothetical protein
MSSNRCHGGRGSTSQGGTRRQQSMMVQGEVRRWAVHVRARREAAWIVVVRGEEEIILR